jgi:hypothetical protein
MDLICYLHPGWEPLIRPADTARPWMDASPESFAYRCLPLDIANTHGWEVLCPVDVLAYWTGGPKVEDVVIVRSKAEREAARPKGAVSLFGQGVLTFHIEALLRTPPGWDLWISGSPNRPKSGMMPLSGVVEADWSPYTFTMNWKFTRRNHWVRFDKGEPICFFFPVQRGVLERMEPKFVPLGDNPPLLGEFTSWSRSRDAFHNTMADGTPRLPAEKWQKRYYRGQGMASDAPVPGHRTRLRLKPFVATTSTSSVLAAPTTQTADPDEMRLSKLLATVAYGLVAGEDEATVAHRVAAAGVPTPLAARLAAVVMHSAAAAVGDKAMAQKEPDDETRPDKALRDGVEVVLGSHTNLPPQNP